jgi:hypothetical protein
MSPDDTRHFTLADVVAMTAHNPIVAKCWRLPIPETERLATMIVHLARANTRLIDEVSRMYMTRAFSPASIDDILILPKGGG